MHIKTMSIQICKGQALLVLLTLTVTTIAQPSASDILVNKCPRYCICDVLNKYNRADCSGKRLIQSNVGVPAQVQILDLSFNDITVLDDTSFQSYKYLLNLTISHNAIHTIGLNVFRKLYRLRAVDLSYNRLEYLDSSLFDSNVRLHTLNLEGNKLMSLPNEPLVYSYSLHRLNLANSLIDTALAQHYNGMPKLQELDLSRNLFITIDDFASNPPPELKTLNLYENKLNCDHALKQAIERLQERNITVQYNNCKALLNEAALERIEMFFPDINADLFEGDSQEDMREPFEEDFAWQQPTSSNEYKDDLEYNDYNYLDRDQRQQSIPVVTNDKSAALYSKIDVLFIFICGVMIGVGVTIFIGTCVLCIVRCTRLHKAAHPIRHSYMPAPSAPPAVVQEPAHLLMPMPQRRVRNSRRAPATASQRALVRHDYIDTPGSDNFIARLFGRPARHQYYRTINENTATLIRRLSRSNLLNNRLSQHFSDRARQNTASAPNSPDLEDAATPLDDELPTLHSRDSRRPETPPPNYSEIVAKNSA